MNTHIAHVVRTVTHAQIQVALLGGVGIDIHTVRSEFAKFVAGHRHVQFGTWQEPWNAWTGAVPGSTGSVRIHQHCTTCYARGFDMRRGSVCSMCKGRKRAWASAQALYLEPPDVDGD